MSTTEKKGEYIPLPVTDNPVPAPKTTRRRKFVGLTILFVHLLAFHLTRAEMSKKLLCTHICIVPTTRIIRKKGHFIWGKEAEDLYLSVPDEGSALAASRLYATKPHLAGTPKDEPIFAAGSPESRHATSSIPKSKKPSAWIDVYYPVMNTPLDRSLQVLNKNGEVVWEAELEEVVDETDPEANKYYLDVPTFHGLSASGDVQGKLVYANYGQKEDYDALVEKGVNLTGAIVICRYGAIFRGLKIKGAQELGAAGVLIYSDLRDDGSITEANGYLPYPYGPARNADSVQRGSVQFLSVYPGDPTTPGLPAYENSTRTDGDNIPKIPSLPISAANAAKLFKLVEEEGTEVHLVNNVDTKVTPIWNTMGVIPGFITVATTARTSTHFLTVYKDEVVVLGNHRDAWVDPVMGATDPSSGSASVNEVVRGLGALLKKGWKPLRTILIASWDAEEYGLIGSTEWVEDFPEFVDKHVVTYLNLDSSVGGSRFYAAASPSLSHFLRQAALDIPHPTSPGRTLWDARFDNGPYGGEALDADSLGATYKVNAVADSLGISPLGSGSDFTISASPARALHSEAQRGDAVYHYHSVFDSERWQEIYADPGFHRHVAVAKHIGLELVRLSTAVVLPLNTTHYTYELENYLNGIESLALASAVDVDLAPLRKSIIALQAASHSLDFEKAAAEKELRKIIHRFKHRHRKLKKKLRKAYCRLKKIFGRKSFDGSVDSAFSKFRLGRLPAFLDEQQGLSHEVLLGLALHAGSDGILPDKFPLAKLKKVVKRLRAVNKKLVSFEKGFISKDGIPDREWYKHLAIAPGKWLGYGATPLPALQEAIKFEKNSTLAQYEVGRLTELIDKLSKNIAYSSSN
ncbi:Zn-dependent exopeptidase [Mycena venus]|uniref:Zn-dependent exopeptidase n=1 Tax=Mycena venus TaxID=2733690 RepID=A0A8H6Y1X8_9AGAR|nr:Zn-dependent exopeptidase [Mycena venus]